MKTIFFALTVILSSSAFSANIMATNIILNFDHPGTVTSAKTTALSQKVGPGESLCRSRRKTQDAKSIKMQDQDSAEINFAKIVTSPRINPYCAHETIWPSYVFHFKPTHKLPGMIKDDYIVPMDPTDEYDITRCEGKIQVSMTWVEPYLRRDGVEVVGYFQQGIVHCQ